MLHTSSFVCFSHNGANGPESKTTVVLSSLTGGGAGSKDAVHDCRVVNNGLFDLTARAGLDGLLIH